MNSLNPGARSAKRSAAGRSAAALVLGWLAVGCGPTEPGGSKPADGTVDPAGTLEIRACLPGGAVSRRSFAGEPDSAWCDIGRGDSVLFSRKVGLQPGRCYTGTFWDLSPAGDYTATVFVRSDSGITMYFGHRTGIRVDSGAVTTAVAALVIFRPVLASPADASHLNEPDPVFCWNPLRGASAYRLEVASDSNFNQMFFGPDGLTSTEYTHGSAIPPGNVYWRVLARDDRGVPGLWSPTWRFSIAGGEAGVFTIRGLGVRFGPWDPVTNRAGDFLFLPGYTRLYWEFGLPVGDGMGGIKQLPDFGYLLPMDVWVTAVAAGRIVRAVYQEETRDWEFTAVSTADPGIQVGYDHLTEPRIGEGDTVAPGDTLGRPGTWDGTLGRTEITIHDVPAGQFRCPLLYLDPGTADSLAGLIDRHMLEWETFTGDTAIYRQEDQPVPGCRAESIGVY